MTEFRAEADTMGTLNVPKEKYYGCQTARSLINFDIGQDLMPPRVIRYEYTPKAHFKPRKILIVTFFIIFQGFRHPEASCSPSQHRAWTARREDCVVNRCSCARCKASSIIRCTKNHFLINDYQYFLMHLGYRREARRPFSSSYLADRLRDPE